MAYWLMKSEPTTYSWHDLLRDRTTEWDGVRNPTARIHLKAMKQGDEAFFYHSGDERQVVGIMRISREAQPDPKTLFASLINAKPSEISYVPNTSTGENLVLNGLGVTRFAAVSFGDGAFLLSFDVHPRVRADRRKPDPQAARTSSASRRSTSLASDRRGPGAKAEQQLGGDGCFPERRLPATEP